MAIKTIIDTVRMQADLGWGASEAITGALTSRALARIVPHHEEGAGPKGVMTLPGFTGPEFSMQPLNRFLNRCGYDAIGWGQGQNLGPQGENAFVALMEMAQVLGDRIKAHCDKTGGKIALVGQSLGGVYARELAFLMPDHIERIIGLGSPTMVNPDTMHHVNSLLTSLMQRTSGKSVEEMASEQWMMNRPSNIPNVPFVSIYSPFDGAVMPDSVAISGPDMRTERSTITENIEVVCSHTGMASGPLCLFAVADRLAVDMENWTRFDPTTYAPERLKPLVKAWYPRPIGTMPGPVLAAPAVAA
ncbi:MAG: hypothetical protein ABF335_09960 [Alphaproteobacteria bacterium]